MNRRRSSIASPLILGFFLPAFAWQGPDASNPAGPATTPDWRAAQQAAGGCYDVEIEGLMSHRINLTIQSNIRELEFEHDFIKPS